MVAEVRRGLGTRLAPTKPLFFQNGGLPAPFQNQNRTTLTWEGPRRRGTHGFGQTDSRHSALIAKDTIYRRCNPQQWHGCILPATSESKGKGGSKAAPPSRSPRCLSTGIHRTPPGAHACSPLPLVPTKERGDVVH